MRNFKKFLALVLAMLMVSACAISVSAVAFDDQAAINETGHKAAVELLTSLGVISGRGDGTFDPAGTLTREEAAVIFAKLKTGDAGRKTDWVAATCNFADVEDKWSFAYINAVSQRGIMEGDGVNFNPKDTLTIEQALTAAVKAFAGGKSAVAELDKLGTPAYWATNWIAVAEEKGLTAGLSVIDYSCPCTRAQMAQIGFNLFNKDAAIKNGFKLTEFKGTVISISDSVVTLKNGSAEVLVDLTAFETAMSAANISGKAADYLNAEVTISYSGDVIYGLSASRAYSFTYADGVLANVMDGSTVTKYITLDGVKYTTAAAETTTVIGASTKTDAIVIKDYDAKGDLQAHDNTKAFPKYYTAVAFDTNNDGDYEELNIKAYEIGTFAKKDNILKADTVADASDIARVEIKAINGTVAFDNGIATYLDPASKAYSYKLTGEEIAFDETPVLYKVTFNAGTKVYDIDVMEVAEKVSGTVIGKASNYINVDGTKYTFAPSYVEADTWTLSQAITFYTIGGEYVKVAGDAKSTAKILVDSVAVVDGKAVITGLNATDGYKKVTFTVEGYTDDATSKRLVKKGAFAVNDDTDPSDKRFGKVILADKADGTAFVTFEEGKVYSFTVTTDGLNYVIKGAETAIDAGTASLTTGTQTLKVDGSYVYIDGKKAYITKDVVVVTRAGATNNANSDGRKNFYGDYTFSAAATLAAKDKVTAVYTKKDNKVNFVYVTAGDAQGTTATSFEEGAKLVQVCSNAIEETYDYSTYEAYDLMTGEKITVKANGAVKGQFYVVKGDTVAFGADNNTTTNQAWVAENSNIMVDFDGNIIGTIKATTTKLTKAAGSSAVWQSGAGDVKEYDIGNTKIYEVDADGIIVPNTAGTAAKAVDITKTDLDINLRDTENAATPRTIKAVKAYAVPGTLIVIGLPQAN